MTIRKTTRLLTSPIISSEHHPLTQPIYETTLFSMPSYQTAIELEKTIRPNAYYTRWGNPTVSYLEEELIRYCGAESCLIFPSGMAAIFCTLFSVLEKKNTVAVSKKLYGDTLVLFEDLVDKLELELVYFDPCSEKEIIAALSYKPKLIYFESIANPCMELANFAAINAARPLGTRVICDCTLTPPGMLKAGSLPLDCIQIHSASKYLCGHYTVHAGVVLSEKESCDHIWKSQTLIGSCVSPDTASKLSISLKTLAIRLKQQTENANRVIDYLHSQSSVIKIHYAKDKHWLNFEGSVFAFELDLNRYDLVRFFEALKIIRLSVSMGGVYSNIEHAVAMSHSMLSGDEELSRFQPPKNLIRLSIGLEDAEDLISDLEQALSLSQHNKD